MSVLLGTVWLLMVLTCLVLVGEGQKDEAS